MCAQAWARISYRRKDLLVGGVDPFFWSYEDGSLELLAAVLSPWGGNLSGSKIEGNGREMERDIGEGKRRRWRRKKEVKKKKRWRKKEEEERDWDCSLRPWDGQIRYISHQIIPFCLNIWVGVCFLSLLGAVYSHLHTYRAQNRDIVGDGSRVYQAHCTHPL